jgi:hypothetical protein
MSKKEPNPNPPLELETKTTPPPSPPAVQRETKPALSMGDGGIELNDSRELMQFCEGIAKTNFVPSAFRGKPAELMAAVTYGRELGQSPLVALQNLAVINGRVSIWGDLALSLVLQTGLLEDIQEEIKGSIDDESMTAICTVTRKGMSPHTVPFSMKQAKRAGLWGKRGPWQDYPDRMLMNRARAFALRDRFADALRGLALREETQEYNTNTTTAAPTLDDVAEQMED